MRRLSGGGGQGGRIHPPIAALRWPFCSALCLPSPRPRQLLSRCLLTWPWYREQLWQEECGSSLWRPARRGGRVERWDPLDCWHFHPWPRLTLLEGETATGRPRAMAVDWWGRAWDNDSAR